ncbi:MAG: polymer-forming cytoskeletal protein [Desulfobacterales bacterium]|nr:polymer-forming cytoskeletal protein [Desulfobacterales bacterium]MBF0397736.1 polymer-forming cytoskeletal protein [Desulfobacterales bacterium]
MMRKSKVFSIIDNGTEIEGKISTTGRLIIKGKVSGTLFAENVVVAKEGSLKGDVKAHNINIAGFFDGNADVINEISVLSTGSCLGKVSCKKIDVEVHGVLNAEVSCTEIEPSVSPVLYLKDIKKNSKEALPKKEIEKKETQTKNIIIDNFSISYEKKRKDLKVSFNIKKEEKTDEKMTIYVFVVLKTEKNIISIPNVSIKDGKPSTVINGKRVSFHKSNNVIFNVKTELEAKEFNSATIFLFDTEEKLIFEKKILVT